MEKTIILTKKGAEITWIHVIIKSPEIWKRFVSLRDFVGNLIPVTDEPENWFQRMVPEAKMAANLYDQMQEVIIKAENAILAMDDSRIGTRKFNTNGPGELVCTYIVHQSLVEVARSLKPLQTKGFQIDVS